jgi:hypothetical protein
MSTLSSNKEGELMPVLLKLFIVVGFFAGALAYALKPSYRTRKEWGADYVPMTAERRRLLLLADRDRVLDSNDKSEDCWL